MDILSLLKENKEYIINCRRELHKIPEIDMNLPQTISFVKERLDELNIEYKEYEGFSGLTAVIGKKEGKVIGLRADMDGLPIKEETNLEYKSTNKNMHACGHDTHTAMLLGAAKVLKENEDLLNGKVKLIFQPAEETAKGAREMVNQGVLKNPDVDIIIGQHIASLKGLKAGSIIIKDKNMMASADSFYIKVIGQGGHGSMPELCIDPIFISTQVINSIQGIISREISATDSVVISMSNIKSEQPDVPVYNVIPNYVEILGTVRCSNNSNRDLVEKRMGEIIENVVKALGGKSEFKYMRQFPPLMNDTYVTNLVINSSEKIIGKENIIVLDKGIMGSEDMSYFFEEVPGTYFGLNASLDEEIVYPAHHPKFKIDDEVLYKGSAIFVQSVFDYLG